MISVIINTRDRKKMLFSLLECLKKVTTGISHEIIVVDDCSDEKYEQELYKLFPKTTFIRNSKRLFLIASRNKGWKKAKGDILFFIDDDNEIKDLNFFSKALALINFHPEAGVIGCRTYYYDNPKVILIGPNRFSKLTGKTTFLCMNQKDTGEFEGLVPTHDNPNAFFIKTQLLKKVKGFSEEIVQTFSEADLAEKVRKEGLMVYQESSLKVYHKSPKVNFKRMSVRLMGNSPERFYYLMRNRFIFIKKYATLLEKISFTLFFAHLYSAYYFGHLIIQAEWKMLIAGLRGVRDGFFFMISNKLPNFYKL